MKEFVVAILIALLVLALTGAFAMVGYEDGYNSGQKDAMRGQYHFTVQHTPNGDQFIRLAEPTTQRTEVKP